MDFHNRAERGDQIGDEPAVGPEVAQEKKSKFAKLAAKFYKKKVTEQEAEGEFSMFKALKVLEEY